MVLYIIGNGFDLHNSLETSYSDYKKYLNLHHKGVVDRAGKYAYTTFNSENWCSIERNLKFNYMKYFKDYCDLFNCEWITGKPLNEFPEKLPQFWGAFNRDLFLFVGLYFYIWLLESYSNCKKATIPNDLIALLGNRKDIFVNFNYTSTLEDIYKIPKDNILYLHGKLSDINSEKLFEPSTLKDKTVVHCLNNQFITNTLQFGSPENYPDKAIEELKKIEITPKNNLFSKDDLLDNIYNFCSLAFKNIEKNTQELSNFISRVQITEVVIMGHSYWDIDMPYYDNVLFKELKHCLWTFYCYDDNDLCRANKFMQQYSLLPSKNPFPKWSKS